MLPVTQYLNQLASLQIALDKRPQILPYSQSRNHQGNLTVILVGGKLEIADQMPLPVLLEYQWFNPVVGMGEEADFAMPVSKVFRDERHPSVLYSQVTSHTFAFDLLEKLLSGSGLGRS